MLKSILKFSVILLIAVTSVKAQNDGSGNTGLAFLKLGVTSRAVSMGEAIVSNTTDASATNYNPAALMSGLNGNLVFTHN